MTRPPVTVVITAGAQWPPTAQVPAEAPRGSPYCLAFLDGGRDIVLACDLLWGHKGDHLDRDSGYLWRVVR